MDIEKAKELLNKTSKKSSATIKKTNSVLTTRGIGWEIGAYAVRALSVATPTAIIMTLENSWVKNGLGLLATLLIIALLIIFKEPIKVATSYAPGVIPFAIFIVVALFFHTTAQSLLAVGISGLAGSFAAIPLHVKYLSYQRTEKSPELTTLETIAESLKNLK